MPHPTGHRASRCLLAVLAFAVTPLTRGDEGKLAPVIDLKPRHNEPAARLLAEPKALIVAAKAMPLPTDTNQTAGNFAPVIRVYEPIRPAQRPRTNPVPLVAGRNRSQTDATNRSAAVSAPQRFGMIELAGQDPVSARSELDKPRPSVSDTRMVEVPRRSTPLVTEAPRSPIEARPTESAMALLLTAEPVRPAKATPPAEPRRLPETAVEVATAPRTQSSPIVELAADPIGLESPSAALLRQPTFVSESEPVLKLVDAEPLLALLQPSPYESDLPSPIEPLQSEEQLAEAEELEALQLDVRPIHELSTQIAPKEGELPKNYAKARFVREGEIAHSMGYSRTEVETQMNWEAPALCYRPLYFQDVNLERHGHKIPLIQPAVSAAHFFGRVPLLPYMAVSEGHRKCRYPLGHYRPGDYAPYSLYIPRLRLDATAAEAAVAAGLILAFP